MSRFKRDELHELLGVAASRAPEAGTADANASTSPGPPGPAHAPALEPLGAPAPRRAHDACFTAVHAELGKVLPTLWARACTDATRGGRVRERFVALLHWWVGKHGYTLHERVAIGPQDLRRLDFVVQAGATRLALEMDARFSAASVQKLQAAQRAGYAVMAVWTTQADSREQARQLRRRVADALGVRNLHWLPMFHACWGWV